MSLCRWRSGGRVTTSKRQPVEQIGAEAAFARPAAADARWSRRRCGRRPERPARADPGHLAIFDRAQQPVLGRAATGSPARRGTGCRHRPPRSGPARALVAPVKAPASWPNSSASIRVSGKRRAVHHDQRPVPARGQMVEALGDQLLAGAALADHQHRPVERRGAARPLDRVEEGGGLADQLGVAFHSPIDWDGFPTSWQEQSARIARRKRRNWRFSAISAIGTALVRIGVTADGRRDASNGKFRETENVQHRASFEQIATAAVGALVLSTVDRGRRRGRPGPGRRDRADQPRSRPARFAMVRLAA